MIAGSPAVESCGSTWSQGSKRSGQRGWKRQPRGMLGRVGQLAARAARAARRAARRHGTAATSACVYGCPGRSITSRASPCSTMRPRYITAIRSHSAQARLRSWVMNSSASPRARAARAARAGSARAPRRRASRPARRRRSRRARARAPRRSRRAGAGRPRARAGSGRRSARASRPTSSSARATRAACSAFATPWTTSGSATIVLHPPARVQRLVGVLEDHLDPPAQRPQARLAADLGARRRDRAGRRRHEPEQRARQRRLAAARLADDAEDLAAPPLERHAVERPRRARRVSGPPGRGPP